MDGPQTFLTFRRFQDPAFAEEIAGLLRESGIESEVETNDHFFNPSFSSDPISQGMVDLKLHPDDFSRAHLMLSWRKNY